MGIDKLIIDGLKCVLGHSPKEHDYHGKDRIIESMFGGMGLHMMSDEAQSKWLLNYMNRINPPPRKSKRMEDESHE